MLPTIEWKEGKIIMVDQRLLPTEEIYHKFENYEQVAEAIETMIIRGAPAIGIAAAMGIALGYKNLGKDDKERFIKICDRISETRPTAKNLFWAIERMKKIYNYLNGSSFEEKRDALINEALEIEKEDVEMNKKMGDFGASLIEEGDGILTHCNAGALATGGYGTALGVIRSAFFSGKKIKVYADETRPFLQGARLTTWELINEGIETYLISDNMAGFFMRKGYINKIVVGADRIVSNGDIANKIGTYSVAVLAKENNIPFYVAAPYSTFDLSLKTGEQIPIEERNPNEILEINGKKIAPDNVRIINPAFDITPAKYISAIITEKGVIYPPFSENIKKIIGR
jgi:methylthioribose-1-phosphate isomerase